jgi:hypothetical protein
MRSRRKTNIDTMRRILLENSVLATPFEPEGHRGAWARDAVESQGEARPPHVF